VARTRVGCRPYREKWSTTRRCRCPVPGRLARMARRRHREPAQHAVPALAIRPGRRG